MSLFEDVDGSVWVGTYGGVSHFKGGKITNYRKVDGFFDDERISRIFRDREGLLWFGTEGRGVVCSDGSAWLTLDDRDGFPGEAIRTISQDAKGDLWFGGSTGLVRYRKSKQRPNPPNVTIHLDREYQSGETLPRISIGERVTFRYGVVDTSVRTEHRRFSHTLVTGLARGETPKLSANLGSATTATELDWIPRKAGHVALAVQYMGRDLNRSEPCVVMLTVIPQWYQNGWIVVPGGAALLGLVGWAIAARWLYLRKREEALQLREQLLKEEYKARRAAERAREAADSANAAKSQFLASMSHELRTPLNAIIGYSEIVQEELTDLGVNEVIPDLEKINAAARHQLGLVNDILDLSKIEAGKMTLFIEEFDVAKLVQEVAATIQPLVAKNSNRLVVECPANIGTMRTDQTK
ncbi:MAG: histidine kinase dimerization/phospho-acceptor domain-containing protein, partial [Verrucomicrobiota bacterium]